jgi:uncharacterized protein
MIQTIDELRRLYGRPGERAIRKELDELDRHCLRFIELSPFLVMATAGDGGQLDASPRGGAPGFVKNPDPRTLLIPDFVGNNRLDSLANIVATGRAGLLFFIPGVDETLRVNGAASLSRDPERMAFFAELSRPPTLVVELAVEETYLHCAKALMRSGLWASESRRERSVLPTLGEMLRDQTGSAGLPETQDEMLARYANEL